jgi:hypothetical protein
MQSALASSTEHMNKALKKMMKTGQWRKEWNRASGKESLPKSEQHVVQVDLVTKIQAVRQEMAGKVQESESKLLEAQKSLIEQREKYIGELRRQLSMRSASAPSLEEQLSTGAAYTSRELERFLAEQEAQLDKDQKSYKSQQASPVLAAKSFRKVVRQELEFVAKSLSGLLVSRKTRAELVENAILFDYSYETPDGGHSGSGGHSNNGGSPNTGLNACLGMTTEELQLLTQFHSFARQLAKDNLVLKWGDIEREEVLGEGAYSVVEQGWCQGRLVAIKLFKTARNSALQAFMREVNALRACQNNPHTIKLVGVCVESRDKLCIITPLYKGGSIHDALYKHGHIFSTDQALSIACDMAAGLAQIHSCGLIHRDLTPTNVLLHPDANGKSFIADFGIAVSAPDSPVASSIMTSKSPRGHPRYKAPELVLKDPYTEKIDIWQFGTMLYVLFSNKRPFETIADRDVASKMALGELPDLSLLPRPIKQLLHSCWHLSPSQRPSPSQLVEALAGISPDSLHRRSSAALTKSHSLGELGNKKSVSKSKRHSPQNSLLV